MATGHGCVEAVRVVEGAASRVLGDCFHGDLGGGELIQHFSLVVDGHVEATVTDKATGGDWIDGNLSGSEHVRGLLDVFLMSGSMYFVLGGETNGESIREPEDVLARGNAGKIPGKMLKGL